MAGPDRAGLLTGARLTDLARLQAGAWDRAQNAISFNQKKTGGAVWVPVHPGLAARLSELPGVGKAPLLPRLSGKATSGKSGLSAQFRKIMEKAGIAPGIARARPGARRPQRQTTPGTCPAAPA
jgi:integrase